MNVLYLGFNDRIYVPWAESPELWNKAKNYMQFIGLGPSRVIVGGNCPAHLERMLPRSIQRDFSEIDTACERIWILAHGSDGFDGILAVAHDGRTLALRADELLKQMCEEQFEPGKTREIIVFSCYAGRAGAIAHYLFEALREKFPGKRVRVTGYPGTTGAIQGDGHAECVIAPSEEDIDAVAKDPSLARANGWTHTLHEEDLVVFSNEDLFGAHEAPSTSSASTST
jgi:hypothetical protein